MAKAWTQTADRTTPSRETWICSPGGEDKAVASWYAACLREGRGLERR